MQLACQLVVLCLLSSLLCASECSAATQLYEMDVDYNKNVRPPGGVTQVEISLFINRVSAVDENKEEISLDVFLNVQWKDRRVRIVSEALQFMELTWEQRQFFWIPDLYIRQLREMRVLSLFQEMTSLRLYRNQTMRISIGATVIIKCDMDFVLYPLDVQKCKVDFSSYKYTTADMVFKWQGTALSFPSDFTEDGYRLPKYVVSFTTDDVMGQVFYGEGNHSTARMHITMSRELRSYLLESYLPSSLFVIMSWGSFVVIPEMVPGRMVLLVTTLLSLVTMFDTVRNNSPNALELKCIEVWIISCTLFVFFALIEYFVVLFGIRYDKHWRHKKKDLERAGNANAAGVMVAAAGNAGAMAAAVGNAGGDPSPKRPALGDVVAAAARGGQLVAAGNHVGRQLPPLVLHHRASRVDNLRMFGTSKVGPQDDSPGKDMAAGRNRASIAAEPRVRDPLARRRFQQAAEQVVLYCGSQRGMVDQVSLVLFPICFMLFATVYWISYISEARLQT